MKRALAVLMSLVIMFVMTGYAYAIDSANAEINAVVIEKKNLRAAHKNENIAEKLSAQGITAAKRNKDVAALYTQLTAYENSAEEQAYIVGNLEELGVYILESSLEKANKAAARSSGEHISWRSVIVGYDGFNDTWVLAAGGNWTSTEAWGEDVPWYASTIAYEGLTIDIGGTDGVGIRLYNTFGTYYPTYLVNSYVYVSDGEGNSLTSYSRETGIDPTQGVFFKYQDYVTCISTASQSGLLNSQWSYFGRNFSVCAEYSSDFENYHGYADIQYAHTWNNTSINSISVTASSSPTFTVTFSSQDEKFSVTSASETVF